MKWVKWYIILMVVLIGLYVLAEYNRPRVIDWTQTLSNEDKIPYGTYIAFHEMEHYFSGRSPVTLREPIYDHVNGPIAADEVYMLISGGLDITKTDAEALKEYASAGNTVFIAAEQLGEAFRKKFKLRTSAYDHLFSGKDSTSINLVNPTLMADSNYALQKNTLDSHFSAFDTATTTVLGRNNYKEVNFVRINVGDGAIFVHAAPLAFSNFFLLKDHNIDYINKVFSYLPKHPSAVYWDEYYKLGRTGARTPLRVILTKPDLKWAYWLSIISLLLFVLVQAKRRQRIIPIVSTPVNDSKIFVETVSRVYLNQKNHKLIAEKKINFWMDYVRNRFSMPTTELSPDFINTLAHKSGVPELEIINLTNAIMIVRTRDDITNEALLEINRQIDQFYKKAI